MRVQSTCSNKPPEITARRSNNAAYLFLHHDIIDRAASGHLVSCGRRNHCHSTLALRHLARLYGPKTLGIEGPGVVLSDAIGKRAPGFRSSLGGCPVTFKSLGELNIELGHHR